ncbi:patatin-like phospholipase family protein [Vulcanococcus limneticus]|uniref:patatin-like phospholipase family protein n=1 Tax=Vulcanococcus limneticus TaxID=2170428 RepID=UPI00398C1AF9
MTKKLAVVISGAVSLGSYEAGVVYEVLEAIAQHNLKADTDGRSHERIEIDVITGASAGGITATVLAKALLYHGESMRIPYANPLYRTWVEEVRMLSDNIARDEPGLLEVDIKRHKESLLNTQHLDRIAERALPDDFPHGTSDYPITGPHPAVCSTSPDLLVGVAMGNLNGFPLGLPLNHGLGVRSDSDEVKEFAYSQYKDRFVLRIARPDDPDAEPLLEEWEEYKLELGQPAWKLRSGKHATPTWKQIREIALSSGAFPFAFATRQIERHSDQDADPQALYIKRDSDRKQQRMQGNPQNLTDWTKGQYVYTDGGVFENEPIGLAIALIESLRTAPKIYDPERFFLFIAPGARKPDSDPFLNSSGSDHFTVAKALISAIMGQSRFQEWIRKAEDDRIPKVLAVTSRDEVLLGDVFSAFAGFLEEKFRAYDYNVGRSSAQEKIRLLTESKTSLLSYYDPTLPLWPPPTATNRLKDASIILDGQAPVIPSDWKTAELLFREIAKVRTRVGSDGSPVRDQLAELNVLLDNVDPFAKARLRAQVLSRVSSLVGFVYEKAEEIKKGSTDSGNSVGSLFRQQTRIGFWLKAAWAMVRGRRAMEALIVQQVDEWMSQNLHLR